ncbi:zf-HC2 domain-containing protein [Streptomyces sp. CB01881]|uniref:zf-HC2 domain-containing protein n=1 Tax=Streptomyces sp. CB01881 TaxID=2078691 RepID=UPI000CDC6DB1|nr:zf-HC2 domain-containing protein [Streptomyces sp. CB01881]AUY50758.1 hypothetical protein C2142_19450 [Streptomyces sp. CB01881]TYC74144.1 hypothetical protein EH183_19425 [Streptomyces sp. CB01881]
MTAPLSSPDDGDPVEPHAAGPHPCVDELADLAEGLIGSADDAEALRNHLAGCAECRETAEALAEVQALLGSAEPPAMPADVAARLDAALTAAADERDTAAEGPGAPRQASATAGPASAPARPSGPAPAPLGPPGRPATPAAATGPGRSRSRRRRTALLLGAAAALLAAGLGGSLLFSGADRKASDTAAVSAAAPTAGAMPSGTPKSARAEHANGGTVYRDDQLAAQVQQLLARTGVTPNGSAQPSGQASRPSTGKSEVPPADAQQGIAGGPGTAACPAPADGPLLATDTGSYSGAPAEVLVYAVPDQPQKLDVYLRSPGCGPVLLHRTVPAR